MVSPLDRRAFLKQGAVMGAGVAAAVETADAAEEKAQPMPAIKLGRVDVSRLILGSNPFFGFAHKSGGLAAEMKAYYTDERIMAVLDEAASHGITAVASPPYDRWIRLWARYREKGGKLTTWIAQPDPRPEDMRKVIKAAGKGGAGAVFIQGARADEQFAKGDFKRLRGWLDLIRSFGVPAGLASHRSDTHLEYERRGLPTDFYFQCFYNPGNGYKSKDRQKAVESIQHIEKPVVGYKILAAGRLKGKDGFAFAFRHLRGKDGVCVGMFPKHQPDQIAVNARLTRSLSVG